LEHQDRQLSPLFRFVKIWKVHCPSGEDVGKTDVTELQILREHTDYLSVLRVEGDSIISASGDGNIFLHRCAESR
jgi:exonuclease III